MTKLRRSSGLLLHPTSLPGRYGIGELGEMAYRWVDFLEKSGQTVWQILPLGPTGFGNSPYQTTSVFAGNPLLLDMEKLVREGCLPESVFAEAPVFSEDKVDFEAVIEWKLPLLLKCYQSFIECGNSADQQEFDDFCRLHDQTWLDDFALFMAIKSHFEGRAWNTWPDELKLRHQGALGQISRQLKSKIMAYKFLQFLFFKQWMELKKYANERGVQIMGDIPIYVTYDSADVWANQDKFCLEENGNPTVVAGVPPDYFSDTGQLWGNPIYRWELMEQNTFRWWIERVKVTLQCVDLVRIDHFRGFEAYWAVPFGEETAINGEWVKGPGHKLFDALLKELGDIPLVAEDLGMITPEVEVLRDRYNFPGMKILHFAFGGDANDPYLPHNFIPNCIVYTGSHDNDTTRGWYESARCHERENLTKYLSREPNEISWDLMRLASASVAVLAIFPLQDVLNLGTKARMNLPGNPTGNWTWRVRAEALEDRYACRLAKLSGTYGRLPSTFPSEDCVE